MTRNDRSQRATTMFHHVREIQFRLLAVVAVLIVGMAVGYFFYEQLFQFIKSPLHTALHYTSPAGSFNFIIKICMMVGLVGALPVAVYNIIMFIQPALRERISTLRVYVTTLLSLSFALAGASFAFAVIIPMALAFFFKFQVNGLEALISADDYLQFVVNVIVTFALLFQLPLIMSFIDHIRPLPPRKLFKAEKFIVVGSIAVGILVPFALDPIVQLLIASPIIILYNLSIVIVVLQQRGRKRRLAADSPKESVGARVQEPPVPQKAAATPQTSAIRQPVQVAKPRSAAQPPVVMDVARPGRNTAPSARSSRPAANRPQPLRSSRLISDMRPQRSSVQRVLPDA